MKVFISYIWSLLRAHKKLLILLSFCAFLAAVLEILAPLLMGTAFDRALAREAWTVWAGLLVGWFVLRHGAQHLRTFINKRGMNLGERVAEKELLDSIRSLLKKPIPFHHGTKSHETSDQLTHLRWETTNIMRGGIFDLIPAFVSAVAIIGYVSYLDWRIGLTITASFALFFLYTIRISKKWEEKRRAWFEKHSAATTPGWDALQNILVIKSTTNEEAIGARLDRGLEEFYKADEDLSRTDKRMQDTQNAIASLSICFVFILSASNLASGAFTLGTVFAVSSYVFTVLGYVTYLQWTYRAFAQGSTNYERAQKLLTVPPEDYSSGREHVIRGSVSFENVAFRYLEEKSVLEDVSFEARQGERIALVGESGEGKTTIVELLGRYYGPKAGTIRVDGVPVGEINLRSLRSQMAYVPQDLSLLHESIEENIRFGRASASDEEVREAAKKAHLYEFIENLPEKWKTVVGERGMKLSGGQRQRIALARAFLRNPQILILDEPTSNLDSKTESLVQESLAELMKGKTTFIIAHRLRTVIEADKILVLKDGRIVEEGTHKELLQRKGVYAELRHLQEQVV